MFKIGFVGYLGGFDSMRLIVQGCKIVEVVVIML